MLLLLWCKTETGVNELKVMFNKSSSHLLYNWPQALIHTYTLLHSRVLVSKHETDSNRMHVFDTTLRPSRFGELLKGWRFIFGSQYFLLNAGVSEPPQSCSLRCPWCTIHPLFPPPSHHFSLLHGLSSAAIHPRAYRFLFGRFLPPPPSLGFFGPHKAQLCPSRAKLSP